MCPCVWGFVGFRRGGVNRGASGSVSSVSEWEKSVLFTNICSYRGRYDPWVQSSIYGTTFFGKRTDLWSREEKERRRGRGEFLRFDTSLKG